MDPEPPTRRIPPTAPPAVPPAVPPGERVIVDDPERAVLADRVRSLRSALALVGLLAAAALGVGLWALLTKEEEDDARRGATPASVRKLDDRVDALEARVDERATKTAVTELRTDQQELRDQVSQVAKQAAGNEDTAGVEESLEQLQADIQELQGRLEQVEEAQQEADAVP